MANEPAGRTNPRSGGPGPEIMSITITDPPANETVGAQFTVQGTYYCDQTATPTITCSRTGPNNSTITAVYVTSGGANNSGNWEAYFNDLATGASTVTATISHEGQPPVPTSVGVTVSNDPGVTVTSPKEGDSVPVGTCAVSGTCALGYANQDYQILCSLTSNGFAPGGSVAATVNSRTGSWTANLSIGAPLNGDPTANINVAIVPKGTTKPVCGRAVGKLKITS